MNLTSLAGRLTETLAFIHQCLNYCASWVAAVFQSKQDLATEVVALRSQLALYQQMVAKQNLPKPRSTPAFRGLWVLLSKYWPKWQDAICLVKPETVMRWHRAGFRIFWRYKSRRKVGRPTVSTEMRRLIRKIAAENPLWSPERIHDQLVSLGYDPPSPNTIRKYLPKPTRDMSKSSQTWKTFIENHMDVTWAMDFLVVPTLSFRLLYVFVVISHDRRRVVHFGVTRHPTMDWVVQQLRKTTGYGVQPKHLIRDNDSIYGSDVKMFLRNSAIKDIRTAFRSPWQNGICERMVGILRRELLDHVIPLNERHLHRLLSEYIDKYYHPVRTHSSLDHKPPDADPSEAKQQLSPDADIEAEPILGGLYTNYRARAA
jgi:transposase InsO family protein